MLAAASHALPERGLRRGYGSSWPNSPMITMDVGGQLLRPPLSAKLMVWRRVAYRATEPTRKRHNSRALRPTNKRARAEITHPANPAYSGHRSNQGQRRVRRR
jgi:hypothetical protein